jgi:outer membrane protein assembly factor BamB
VKFGVPIQREFINETDEADTSIGTINDDFVFVSYNSASDNITSSSSKVGKYNRFTGDVEWSRNIDNYVFGPQESAGRIYLAGMDSILCWDADTGDEIWRKPLGETVLSLHHVEDQVFVNGFDYQEATRNGEEATEITQSTIYAINPETGEINWSYRSDRALWGLVVTENSIVVSENRSYIMDSEVVREDGRLIGLDKYTAYSTWESESINPQFVHEKDNKIVTLSENNGAYIFDSSGEQISHYSGDISDYFLKENSLLTVKSDGGIRIFDYGGTEQTEKVLYPNEDIVKIQSNDSSDIISFSTDDGEIVAIDVDTYSQLGE